MKINEVKDKLSAEILSGKCDDRTLTGGYVGDLLSHVMANAPSGSVWFTIMNSVNIVAVADLAEIPLIVICEDTSIADEVIDRANKQNITILRVKYDAYTAITKLCV